MMSPLESVVRFEDRIVFFEKPIDREKTCPLLLRVFCCNERHNDIMEYRDGHVPGRELQVYTWMDATLYEIAGLVNEVYPETQKKGTMFDFSLVFPNPETPGYCYRDVGTTVSGLRGPDDSKTLYQLRFTIGEYMDVCITLPIQMALPMIKRDSMRQ